MGVRGSLWSTPWGKVGGEGRENYALGLFQPSSVEGAQADEECGCPLCLERSGQICPDQAKHVRCCLVLKALLGSHPGTAWPPGWRVTRLVLVLLGARWALLPACPSSRAAGHGIFYLQVGGDEDWIP